MKTALIVAMFFALCSECISASRDGVHEFNGTPRQNRMDYFAEAMAFDEMCKFVRINRRVLRNWAARYGISFGHNSSDMAFMRERKADYKQSLRRWNKKDFHCIIADSFYGKDGAFIPGLLVIDADFYN